MRKPKLIATSLAAVAIATGSYVAYSGYHFAKPESVTMEVSQADMPDYSDYRISPPPRELDGNPKMAPVNARPKDNTPPEGLITVKSADFFGDNPKHQPPGDYCTGSSGIHPATDKPCGDSEIRVTVTK